MKNREVCPAKTDDENPVEKEGSRSRSRSGSAERGAEKPAPVSVKKGNREYRLQINFPTKLMNRVAAVGSKVRLTCYLEGADPGIRWYKDEQPVVYSSRLRQTQLNGLCTLEFASASIEDSGLYKCYARNDSGEASTSATLEVYSSGDSADLRPTFTRTLKESYDTKNNEITVTTHVRAIPRAEISWSIDSMPVEPSDKFRLTETDDGVCELNVKDATRMDNGKYVCMAENRAGHTIIAHHVQIPNLTKRSSTSTVSSVRDHPLSPMSESEDDTASISSKQGRAIRRERKEKKGAPPAGGRRHPPQSPPDLRQNLYFLGMNDLKVMLFAQIQI